MQPGGLLKCGARSLEGLRGRGKGPNETQLFININIYIYINSCFRWDRSFIKLLPGYATRTKKYVLRLLYVVHEKNPHNFRVLCIV